MLRETIDIDSDRNLATIIARVLSTGGGGGGEDSPPNTPASPPRFLTVK